MRKKLVSVIVTTKNEQQNIKRLLESVNKQTYKKIELIVVDNHSKDLTKRIAKKITPLVFNAGPERSAQRNFGLKQSHGEFVFFVDADMELSESVIESCVKLISKSKKTGMVVVNEISRGWRFWEKVKAFERSFYNDSGDSNIEAARFFKTGLVKQIGGYDESITGPEDWDLPERLKAKGFKQVRTSESIFHHEHIESLKDLARKKYYYGLRAHSYISKNKVSLVGAKTIYILRPVFYKQWKKLIASPVLSLAMFLMLTVEQISGGWGFVKGKINKI